ncbi:hypothetical protein [Gordonia polyisoprenivorans]|uniref:hypothetical protein n=1 Tax=Gordonia polyisoprenivorans TaxID=84595 RepID=UPI0012DF3B7C|nr:hypothetical protein [Gordonia polyisoprenivorans]
MTRGAPPRTLRPRPRSGGVRSARNVERRGVRRDRSRRTMFVAGASYSRALGAPGYATTADKTSAWMHAQTLTARGTHRV